MVCGGRGRRGGRGLGEWGGGGGHMLFSHRILDSCPFGFTSQETTPSCSRIGSIVPRRPVLTRRAVFWRRSPVYLRWVMLCQAEAHGPKVKTLHSPGLLCVFGCLRRRTCQHHDTILLSWFLFLLPCGRGPRSTVRETVKTIDLECLHWNSQRPSRFGVDHVAAMPRACCCLSPIPRRLIPPPSSVQQVGCQAQVGEQRRARSIVEA